MDISMILQLIGIYLIINEWNLKSYINNYHTAQVLDIIHSFVDIVLYSFHFEFPSRSYFLFSIFLLFFNFSFIHFFYFFSTFSTLSSGFLFDRSEILPEDLNILFSSQKLSC